MPRIALVSAPWPLFNRPSIQLGTLKAYVQQNLPSMRVDAHHLYLSFAEKLGYETYRTISERTWLSESCFAGLLYPERSAEIESFWKKQSRGLSLMTGFQELRRNLKLVSDEIFFSIPWSSYPLVGFSICLGQLTSTLYFIQRLKKAAPEVKIAAGGSTCARQMGYSLLKTFPDIDFVISGEGEKPLLHLVQWLARPGGSESPAPLPGLITRDTEPSGGFAQIRELDELPVPDFSDYFAHLGTLAPQKRFLPRLPMEMSRGCWWRRISCDGTYRGCAFCNLNIQWSGYRAKSSGRIVSEILSLVRDYRILSISFMDNLLPSKNLKDLFQSIAELEKDFRFFGEIRAVTAMEDLLAMAAAGMAKVQVGIEALSSRLLKKLNKGTTAIQNLEIMKNCEASGLPHLTANLITHFPGSDAQDVEETLANLKFALPFQPLKVTPFWLGYGSPVWANPEAYSIKKVRHHPFYARLFPPEILRSLSLMIQAYQGGLEEQGRLWRPVKQAAAAWKKAYERLQRTPRSGPILSYQDGGDFLIIRQIREGQDDMSHRLLGTSRRIYLFCGKNRSLGEILHNFPGSVEEKVLPFLAMMVDKKLMFREADRYLSLAVPISVSHRVHRDHREKSP
jgi:ribosomal peptide maturation radical SAM protein 1